MVPYPLLVPAALPLAVVLHVGGEVPQVPLLREVASLSVSIPCSELGASLGKDKLKEGLSKDR